MFYSFGNWKLENLICFSSTAVPSNVQISGSTSRTVTLGGSLTLQCSALGDPSPTLTWFFRSSNANAVQVGTGTTYGITNAQRTNGGTYICRATNSLGSLDSNGVNVDVQCKNTGGWLYWIFFHLSLFDIVCIIKCWKGVPFSEQFRFFLMCPHLLWCRHWNFFMSYNIWVVLTNFHQSK